MSVSQSIKAPIKGRLAVVLEEYPATRDSDIRLYMYYLVIHHGLKEKIGKENCAKLLATMLEAPPSESIRRMRQKFQEGGEYPGTVRENRNEEKSKVVNQLGQF
jgi:hypothetical protein